MKSVLRMGAFGVLALFFSTAGAMAAGSDDSSSPKADPNYVAAVEFIEKGDYAKALPLLGKVLEADAKNANAENYLGFSHRKLGNRDLAFVHYQKALDLDPDHLGANEYLGELYLEMGDLAKAEERLKVLDEACFFGCEEYYDLRDQVADYKAAQGS
ncbi:MAG: tetratricopeptide repeat protein [Pseudomonadota bacterium]